MGRVAKYYIVENEAGEPCCDMGGDTMTTSKKEAEAYARLQRKQYGERYTVATFVREEAKSLPIRASGAAAARATDRLVGSGKPRQKMTPWQRGYMIKRTEKP